MDKLFCWKNIKILYHAQLDEINQNFTDTVNDFYFEFNSIDVIVDSKNINMKIKKLKL